MKISEASEQSGLPVKTIRYYSDISLVAPSGRSNAGYRRYDEKSLQKLIFIRRAREFGFSIAECRELLGLYSNNARSSADVKKIASNRLEDIRKKQGELRCLYDELSHLVQNCRGDDRPDCPIISTLADIK